MQPKETRRIDQGNKLKSRRRSVYPYFLSYRTRWIDNDQYAHLNNSIYYHLFDSVVNSYLITQCNLSARVSKTIGLVVSSHCHYFAPLSFPDVLDLGLRVTHLGKSSVTYEIAVFKEGSNEPSAVGGYTHVFVDNSSRRTAEIEAQTLAGLKKLLSTVGDDGNRVAKL
ncbi:thioesterase thiol ester dehydrase-isomerase [Auriscalpium vulgare]|uniref:Thioesterase thiol ester dehydrase-isomerase n=1 Tax=Auriscalpium vulgare TaxID=40419 RepID=A0ACB8RZX1_9AGAM|nr:thioesterase thiol ester dehydrase-isomerase [Auriscalpium vulgare]